MVEITKWMSRSYSKGKLLSGIIYLHRITDVRMDGSSTKYVRILQRLCGPKAMKNVFLTTTRWSNTDRAQQERRESELREGAFWGGLIEGGASVVRFMGTRESGLELVSNLTRLKPEPLSIQVEMEKNIPFIDTEVGKFMNEEFGSLIEKYRKEMEDLRKEIREAIRLKDDPLKEILEEDEEQAQKGREKIAAEIKYIASLRPEVLRKLVAEAEKREEEKRRNEAVAIAVSSNDISLEANFQSLCGGAYPTRGRLIYDIDNVREFEAETIPITIKSEASIAAPINVIKNTFGQLFGKGSNMSSNNFIIHQEKYYKCQNGTTERKGSQRFLIFSKY